MRGDDKSEKPAARKGDGSPPRAWGRLPKLLPCVLRMRFTPTCVGTTHGRIVGAPERTVHPHVRGDDGIELIFAVAVAGSPPRAWGRRSMSDVQYGISRFTPTCVGTTPMSSSLTCNCTVHPHVRGDDFGPRSPDPGHGGSPPRAWGRLRAMASTLLNERFTPTCVGTTSAHFEKR